MISSTANPQMKQLVQLLKKSKLRNEKDVFVVEGLKMYLEAPKERIVKTYVSTSLYEKHPEHFKGREIELVEDRTFQTVSDTKTPQGVLCVLRQYHHDLKTILKQAPAHLLILENIQDPGNLGTMIRTGEGAGISGVIMSRDTVDIYNPKTIRSTMGSIYRVPYYYAEDLKEVLEELRAEGVTTYAAHLKGESFYDEKDYTGGTAFLIGNEGNGLREETAKLADCYIKIPMCGRVESLNAAIAASVLMYEVAGQRRKNR